MRVPKPQENDNCSSRAYHHCLYDTDVRFLNILHNNRIITFCFISHVAPQPVNALQKAHSCMVLRTFNHMCVLNTFSLYLYQVNCLMIFQCGKWKIKQLVFTRSYMWTGIIIYFYIVTLLLASYQLHCD